MTPEEQAVSFHHKRLGQRAAIVAAGPLANFLFAIVVLAGLFASVGTPAPLAGVGSVPDATAAAMAGLRPGDRIVAIDGSPVRWFEELRGIVGAAPNVPLKLEVLRQNEQLFVTVTPQTVEIVDADGVPRTIGRLGVTPDAAQIGYERHNPLKAAWLGVEYTVNLCLKILSYIGQMIGGKQSADQLGGPLRIAQVLGDVAQGQGGVIGLIFTAVALSVNLGLINLFPVPMLDGGHLVFYAFEALRGRPLSERVQEYGFRIGVTLVLFLMVFATWNDLIQPRFIEFFRQFIT